MENEAVMKTKSKAKARAYRQSHARLAFLLVALSATLLPIPAGAQGDPPLPPGLGAPASEEPGLPPGLGGNENAEPGLPPGLGAPTVPSEEDIPAEGQRRLRDRLRLHGFWELRAGSRINDDPAQRKDLSVGETRLQLTTDISGDWGIFEVAADTFLDGVQEDAQFDLRQARLTLTPLDNVDLRIGRQVITWGTGDLLFINDLFPKDWQSFLIGRDVEYLKAPSDAVRLGVFNDFLNVDLVYTPRFDADRHITGDYISYYDPLFRRFNGASRTLDTHKPRDWFDNDEVALRLYRNLGRFQVALYGYWGYWKSPGGQRIQGIPLIEATFPRLNVYGASIRGPLGKGIFHAEIGYYDSVQDRGGDNFFINNSEFRAFVGYEQELATDLTGAVQVYWERMLDYDAYRESLILIPPRDRDRLVFTLRLTKLLMNQNLTLSWFSFYSPTDNDAYIRPHVSYKLSDAWRIEGGANVWFGDKDHTFFGQLENNNNVFGSVRYSF